MLKVKNLKVNYGHISALNGISFEVPDNSIVSLIGANGAGKTTTLMAISGLVDAAEGQILLDDMDITDCRPNSIVQMGVCHVPEGRHVFPELSVYENLVAGAIPCKKLPRAELQNRIEQQFELFPRLKERSSQMAGTMSGGEQQMLAHFPRAYVQPEAADAGRTQSGSGADYCGRNFQYDREGQKSRNDRAFD